MSCCTTWPREAAPGLRDLYAKKLLEPGWAGEVNDVEAAHIARELSQSPMLRRLWETRRFSRQRKTITAPIAKRLCRWWAEKYARGDEGQNSHTVEKFKGLD